MTESRPNQPMLSLFVCYRDPERMIAWLDDAFGFEQGLAFDQSEDEGGVVAHAELRLGDAVIMVQRDTVGYEVPKPTGGTTGRAPYIALPSREAVDAMFTRAVDAGATVLREPYETDWQNYPFEVLDPEGYQWSFGIHVPGGPAEEW